MKCVDLGSLIILQGMNELASRYTRDSISENLKIFSMRGHEAEQGQCATEEERWT